MIKMMIMLHQRMIYVDDYLLTDYSSPGSEQIAVNQEVILGLVRHLALLY
jgi:hypothetical protein